MRNRVFIVILSFILGGLHPFQGSAQSVPKTSAGYTPLNDLGTGTYQGYQGGLYPRGTNRRPAAHDSAGRAMAAHIVPRDASGNPDPVSGKIVLLSIGMSNTTQEFSVFKTLADTDRIRNPRLVVVDGAQGGQTASIISNPNANFWTVVDQRLAASGVTGQQVQAIWAKEADANPSSGFPRYAMSLDSEFVLIAGILKTRFPRAACCYWSSRTYGGYATTSLNPEPYAYESGLAVKWFIEKQILGDTSLSFDGARPNAPWLAWGPYLWANGSEPRSDSLVWLPADFGSDGTHPSTQGRLKVARILLEFFHTDSTAIPWYSRTTAVGVDFPGSRTEGMPLRPVLEPNFPNPFNPGTIIRYQLPVESDVRLEVFDPLGKEVKVLLEARSSPGSHSVALDATGLASGVYICRLQVRPRHSVDGGIFVQSRKILLLR